MKTKISRIGKKSLSVVIALMMIVSTMLVGMVSVNAANDPTKAEFYLVGQFTGNNWDNDKTKYKIENNYSGSNVIFYYDVEDTDLNGKWFAICNSSGSRYAPSKSEAIGIGQSNKKPGTYNNSNSWQYTGSATKIRICVDQRDSVSDNMYKPYVWVEEISESTKYTVLKGTETNGTFSVSPTSAAKDTEVTVTTSPASGYEVDTVTYTYGTTTSNASGSGNTYTFPMPAADVTVNVTFRQTSTPTATYYYSYWNSNKSEYIGMDYDADKNLYKFTTNSEYLKDSRGFKITTSYNTDKDPANSDTLCVNKFNPKPNLTASPNAGVSLSYESEYDKCVVSGSGTELIITYDPTATSVSSNGEIKVWSVADYTGTTPTTQYYIGGRFGESWDENSINHPFVSTATTGLYKYETGKTVKQLSAEYYDYNVNLPQYFIIHEGNSLKDSGNFYCGESQSLHNFQLAKNSSNAVTLTKYNDNNTTADRLIRFNDAGNTSTGAVTIWLDASDTSAMKLYYTVDGESDVSGTLKANSTVYATSSKKLDSITLTTKNNGEAVESAVTMTDAGNINGIYYYSYKLTADANAVQFDYSVGGTAKTKTASCVEGKNVYSLDNDSWSVYEIDKSKAYTSGLWVDVQPSVVHTNIALIKWTNKKGNKGSDGNNYKLYLPGGTDLTLPVYSSADYVTINGTTVNDGKTFTFDTSSEYTVKIGTDTTEYKLKVMKSGSASLYTTTLDDLPTASTGSVLEKTAYKNGGFMTVSNEGKIVNDVQTLSQIKGRGNSTCEASGKEYGKYAYNIKLASAINPLNKFDKDAKSKSFCLLANNADQSSLRNILAYNTATKAGVANTPNFEVVDVYNNGEYLGSYLITEKVDVALKNKLVQGDPVDKYHTYTYDDTKKKQATYNYGSGTFEFSYVETGSVAAGVDIETKSYLLEFDLMERAQAEHCWFKTPKGQYIALKTPEDLNEEEMRFIIRKWCEAEDAVYNKSYEEASTLVDMKSFAQVYLIQEWSKNLDSAATSYYIYYDGRQANPKWQATPIWDYDWAFGGHGNTKPVYNPNNDSDVNNYLDNYSGWFAKFKTIVQNDETILDKTWNFQAQLANNESFWNDVITVWNSGFYTSASTAISELATYYTNNSASYAMNEARYGFVGNSYFRTLWGSTDTGSTPDAAKTWLVNWATERLNWMNGKLGKTAQLSGVTISPNAESYTAGDTVTITATPQSPVEGAKISYQIFRKTETDADFVAGAVTSDGVFTFANANAGTYHYKVVATDAYGFTKESEVLTVTVSGVSGSHDVKIYFKSSSTYAYKPSLKFDNDEFAPMDKTGFIGTNYSGSIKFYWYSFTLTNVDPTTDHTITIKTAGTSASGSFTSKFDSTTYYFGIDDLMEGTELVNLSNQPEYIRNYHHTARHMVSSGLASDGTLGFTRVNGIRYQMGSYNPDEVTTVDTASVASVSNTLTTASSFSIKSATAVQMLNVEKAKASLLQTQLLDVNLDGIVDIKDATLIQKALAY